MLVGVNAGSIDGREGDRLRPAGGPRGAPGLVGAMRYVLVGWHLVRRPGLRRFVLAPLAVNLAVFGGLGWWLTGTASEWVAGWTLFERHGELWLLGALETLLRWLLTLALVFALAWLFTLLANLVGAPFNGLLAERVEAHLTGERPTEDPGWLSMLRGLPRLMGSEIAKLLYLLGWLVPLLLLHLVPLVNVVAPALLFLFGAWMFALEYLDYPMGNHGALFRDVRGAARERRRTAFGFGLAVAALSVVPIVNLVVMPVAVAGATALWVDHWRPAAGTTASDVVRRADRPSR